MAASVEFPSNNNYDEIINRINLTNELAGPNLQVSQDWVQSGGSWSIDIENIYNAFTLYPPTDSPGRFDSVTGDSVYYEDGVRVE